MRVYYAVSFLAISFSVVAEMGKPGHFMGKCLGGDERELFKRETSLTTPIFPTAVRTMQARTIAPSNIRRVFSLPPSLLLKSQSQTLKTRHRDSHILPSTPVARRGSKQEPKAEAKHLTSRITKLRKHN